MRKRMQFAITMAVLWGGGPLLLAQTPCPSFSVVINTPEDQLTLAYNGANPQEQVEALDKFAQANPDSKFMPCVNEYYTMSYVKQNNFDKAIEYGEKDLAANYRDLSLSVNLMKAYVGAGKATDNAFDVILKAPDLIKKETTPSRPAKATDEEWQKMRQDSAELAKDVNDYMAYAFFQLLPRTTDAAKRLDLLGQFEKTYPDEVTQNGGQFNFQYFLAYDMAGHGDQAAPYGEKAIAADGSNPQILNLVAYDYVNRQTNLDKAEEYSKKAITLVPTLKKPDGEADDQFKTDQNNQLGMAHVTLGYAYFQKGAKTHKVGPAIDELKTAVDLLAGNPPLRGLALYYLGYAYEVQTPPNHHAAMDALNQAVVIQSPLQTQARDLLAKVKSASAKSK
jgi:tetratricopeptide (TPR) repeat protein